MKPAVAHKTSQSPMAKERREGFAAVFADSQTFKKVKNVPPEVGFQANRTQEFITSLHRKSLQSASATSSKV